MYVFIVIVLLNILIIVIGSDASSSSSVTTAASNAGLAYTNLTKTSLPSSQSVGLEDRSNISELFKLLTSEEIENKEKVLKNNVQEFIDEDLKQENSSNSLNSPNIAGVLLQKYYDSLKSYEMTKKLSHGYRKRTLELLKMIESIKNYDRINQELIDITLKPDNNIKAEPDVVKRQNEREIDTIIQSQNCDTDLVIINNDSVSIDLTTDEETIVKEPNTIVDKNIKIEPSFTRSPNINAVVQHNKDIIVVDDDNDDVETQTHRAEQEKGDDSTAVSVTQLPETKSSNVRIAFEKEQDHSKNSQANCSRPGSRWTLRFPNTVDGVEELIENSGVYVDKNELNKIYQNPELSSSRRTLASLLIKLIFSDDALKHCSVTGHKTVRRALNQHALDIMFTYVDWYGNCKNWTPMSRRDIIKHLNHTLYVIRKKSTQSKQSK